MTKAAAAEQLKLLDLQALDARLTSLDNRRRVLEKDPLAAELSTALRSAQEVAANADQAVKEGRAELQKAEADVEQVTTKIERDESRLYAGGLSKDLEALQKDIVSLTARRSDLEDVELEILERLDALQEEQSRTAAASAEAEAALTTRRATLDAELAEIATERTGVAAERVALAAAIDAGLVELYDKTLARHGVGAARLFHGTSEGSGMTLSPGDLAVVRAAAEDEVVFCPDSGCILVRSPEWS